MLICAVLITQAQTTKPTKEETISWLKEKLENLLVAMNPNSELKTRDIKIISADECSFTVTFKYNESTVTEKFPTDGITNLIGSGLINYKNNVVRKSDNDTVDRTEGAFYYGSTVDVRIDDREADIYARILKAFQHLATFCPKKTETF